MRVLVLFGTRPEAIKMAPVIKELQRTPGIETLVCFTGQHRAMAEAVMSIFGIQPTVDLDVMRPGQTLEGLTGTLIAALPPMLDTLKPDLVLVQGDTTTAMMGALAAFYKQIPVGHIEAGLRTGDMRHPWPEEANRRIVGALATRHYTPTRTATQNLLRENIDPASILETGNTVVDALQMTQARLRQDAALRASMEQKFHWLDRTRKLVLVTGHRRESFGGGFEEICRAIAELARRPDVSFVYPVHLNPNVREPVGRILSGIDNVKLIDPVGYDEFVYLMDQSYLILTDSGGVQEEAPSLGKPVLIMRETSERMEAIEAGVARLVTTSFERIVGETSQLLDDAYAYAAMARATNPFGDGKAASRITADIVSRSWAR
jgi:UDP-N-acetylglucosamine 2-epimerase (non-hydrolysing)